MQDETYHYEVAAGFLEGLRPEERLLVSEWADKHRYLAQGASPEPGLYKTSRTPYLKKIMDCLSSHVSYRVVIFKKSAQVGASELGFNWLGYKMDISPGNILLVMPTEGQAKRNSKMRIDPMIRATPRLNKKIRQSNSKDSSNTILQKDFPGGTLIITGANSASGLRSMPVENLMMDEVDGYPLELDGEGSPIDLALARIRNFKRSKAFFPSTPTVKGMSAIDAEYENTDKQKFHVPCPHCGVLQHLEWQNMKWDVEITNPVKAAKTAYYQCPHCEGHIEEHHKRDMLAAGDWIATDPDKSNSELIGFHCNSLISPWYTFANMVKDYLKCGNDQNKLITFTNTSLGECSEISGDAPKWEDIYNKSQDYALNKPNNNVKFITAGVDVQGNRLEIQIVGWGHGKRRWVLDYQVLAGPYNEPEVWEELETFLSKTWVREDGLEMPLRLMAVDSAAYTSHVYDFCKRFSKSRVVPIRGVDGLSVVFGAPSAANKTEAGKNAGNVLMYPVGSSYMKTELYGYLKLNKLNEDEIGPRGYVHIPKLNDTYYKGLVAEEERIKKDSKGFAKLEWHKVYERNEPLDTMNYARAAAAIVGMDRYDDEWMDRLEDSYQKRTPVAVVKPADITFSNKEEGFWD